MMNLVSIKLTGNESRHNVKVSFAGRLEFQMSRVMGKPVSAYNCENKGTDQLRGNRALLISALFSLLRTIHLLSASEISSP